MEGWSVNCTVWTRCQLDPPTAPAPNEPPDGDHPTFEGSGLEGWSAELEAPDDVDAVGGEDAVEGRAVELELFTAAFLGNAFFFKSFLAAGIPSL